MCRGSLSLPEMFLLNLTASRGRTGRTRAMDLNKYAMFYRCNVDLYTTITSRTASPGPPPLNLLKHMLLCLQYTKKCLLCLRPVSSGEIQLHRCGRSCDGRCSRSLPHYCLHHRDSDCSQGPATSLHGQSVSLIHAAEHARSVN